MASCLLILAVFASVQTFQNTAVKSELQEKHHDRVYDDEHCGRGSFDKKWTKDSNEFCKENKGTAESMIDDLYLKLRDAESRIASPDDYPPHYELQEGEEFDFIVVGAGSAGAVVASRLSEVDEWRVLLVEAGGNPPKVSEFPALAATMQGQDCDWQYLTDHEEENCLGMEGNRCKWPRGKMLGGSSSINYMMFTRGHPRDFDNWAAAGNKGWSYEEVLPYFKKLEDMRDPAVWAMEGAETYHSTGGPLKLEAWPDNEMSDVFNVFAEGMKELGHPFNPDCNGKNLTGFTRMQGSLQDHRRCSTAKAFLSPAKQRKNLFVAKHSLVTKILISNENPKAYGIQLIDKKGTYQNVRAKKEVIVSAGAINSPKVLILSGIGPKKHLEDLEIPLIKNLPVGENLQDHPLMTNIVLTVNLTVSVPAPTIEDTFNFLLKKLSRLSTIGSFHAAAYIDTAAGEDYPDVELLQQHVPKNDRQRMVSALSPFNFKKTVIEEFVKINENAYTSIILASMLRPYSRGRILLQNAGVNTHPKIIAGTFSDKRDIDTFLRTYNFISRLVTTDAMKRVDAKLHEIRIEDCEIHSFASPAYRECAMRHLTATTYHYSGTCKMGPAGDPTAVVDPNLRVVGVEGLRVVDASVMPTIVSAHINAAVVMIGEKASDLIKQTWQGL